MHFLKIDRVWIVEKLLNYHYLDIDHWRQNVNLYVDRLCRILLLMMTMFRPRHVVYNLNFKLNYFKLTRFDDELLAY
jgi:hypothetical protein